MYCECIAQREMTSSMKQGIISLIPKPEKDSLLIDNWRPITLLTVDYNKILALVYANRLKFKFNHIIAETQSGFVKGRHISNNIRLILDLLDYADFVKSEAIILFLDFYKAFDTIEHEFLLQSLKLFGFGSSFVSIIDRDGTIHLPPDSILSRYLGADMICIAIFLRISILQVLRFDFAMCCDFCFLFLTLDHGKMLNDTLNIQTVTIKKKHILAVTIAIRYYNLLWFLFAY